MAHRIVYLIIVCALLPLSLSGEVIWETNFDSIADWQSVDGSDWASTYNKTPAAIPSPFTAYRQEAYSGASTHTGHYINSTDCESGKCYTGYFHTQDAGQWNHGNLGYQLSNTGYEELYIRFRIRYQDDWQWRPNTALSCGSVSPTAIYQKLFRLIYDVDLNSLTGDPQDTRDYTYYAIVTWYGWGSGYESTYPRIMVTARDDDTRTVADDEYQITSAKWYSTFGAEGAEGWHWLEFHLKMNTPYTSANGVFEVWYDGVSIGSSSSITYRGQETQANSKFCYFMFPDNMHNCWAEGPVDQWMKIDSVVVSDAYIGPDYEIGSSPSTPSLHGVSLHSVDMH